jgi:hypothetical protein
LGFVVWPGCITAPLPSRRTPANSLEKSELKFVKHSRASKGDVFAHLGKPDAWYDDLRVACYFLNHVSRDRLVLLLGVIPMGTQEEHPGLEVVLLQFDGQDRVMRHDRRTVRIPPETLLRTEAEQWVRGGRKR